MFKQDSCNGFINETCSQIHGTYKYYGASCSGEFTRPTASISWNGFNEQCTSQYSGYCMPNVCVRIYHDTSYYIRIDCSDSAKPTITVFVDSDCSAAVMDIWTVNQNNNTVNDCVSSSTYLAGVAGI